jgi:hypothetical protein
MSNDFYSVLAEELCSIKNSPFSLLRSNLHLIQDSDPNLSGIHIIKSGRVSNDADRFFNPDKKKRVISDDPAYL